jgi:thymidylate synthase (FAD)
MKNIQVKILNPEVVADAEKMMVFCARLTQRGHNIHNMDDLIELQNKPYREETLKAMVNLPHPTIQKFGVINVAVVGASRRFLAQITRHQNEVKFMSASLQYSDYSGQAEFCVPYGVMRAGKRAVERYLREQQKTMEIYAETIEEGLDNDSAGYLAPQGLRNILIISATPYQWKHMISQRSCRRNTDETRFVMLKIWEELCKLSPMFLNAGPFCARGLGCPEGKMSCGRAIARECGPEDILLSDFLELMK